MKGNTLNPTLKFNYKLHLKKNSLQHNKKMKILMIWKNFEKLKIDYNL